MARVDAPSRDIACESRRSALQRLRSPWKHPSAPPAVGVPVAPPTATHLGKDPPAAPDIQDLLPLQPSTPHKLLIPLYRLAHELQSSRVHSMQEGELPRRIPPVRREG